MELLDVTHTEAGTVRVTIGHPDGLLAVEGTSLELQRLCDALEQVAQLATIACDEDSWIVDVEVGGQRLRLGLRAGGLVRLAALPA
jgi:hypothetical protein